MQAGVIPVGTLNFSTPRPNTISINDIQQHSNKWLDELEHWKVELISMSAHIMSKIHKTKVDQLSEIRELFARVDVVLKEDLERIREQNQLLQSELSAYWLKPNPEDAQYLHQFYQTILQNLKTTILEINKAQKRFNEWKRNI